VTLDGQQWVLDMNSRLTVHIQQIGSNGHSTNCAYGGRTATDVIEDMVKEWMLDPKEKKMVLDLALIPVQTPLIAHGVLQTIKAALDANEKVYTDAMGEIDRIRWQYLDAWGRCQTTKITEVENARLKELSESWTRHLYYPQIGHEFVAPTLQLQGPDVLL
jgi:hypothetical protein